jgi:signal peptidase
MSRLVAAAASGVRHLSDLALVGLILVAASGVILARVVPMTGRATFVVASGSMAPAIPVGSAVIVEPVDPGALGVGDVVSLRSGPQQAIFTHRITRVVDRADGRWIETRGDANGTVDPSITPVTSVIGRVALTLPLAGFVVAWLSLPSGVVAVIAIGFALMSISWVLAGGGRSIGRPTPLESFTAPATGTGR